MKLSDTVQRLRATATGDGYGNDQLDWSVPDTQTLPAEVQPLSAAENVVDQQRTTTRWRMWLGPHVDVLATDRFVWDGDTFEVEGDVERWKIRGRLHHLKVILIKVEQG